MTYSPADPDGAGTGYGGAGPGEVADVGLLSPVRAGTAAERLTGDPAVAEALVRVEAALLHALVDTGVAPARARSAATRVATVVSDPRRLALDAVAGGNPVIPLVRLLRAEVGEQHARWVHFGTTSQDVLDTALLLVAREVCRVVETDLARLAATLATLADRTRTLPVVGRTLTQQAMPTTLGLRVAGWLAGVHDALRLVRTCTRLPVSLGGPVGTAAAYGPEGPAVLEAFAERLGQLAPVSSWHTRRTPVTGLAHALATAGEACGKIAADVLVMSQTEVAEAREGTAGGSSAMPHKANPAQSVLVASAARRLPALGAVLVGSAAAEQERPAGAWHAEWEPLRTMLRLSAGAAERTAGMAEQLRFDEDALAANLDRLVEALGQDHAWVRTQTEHAGTWVDRVLAQHAEVCG